MLFDTKSRSQPTAMGGTGEAFDWALAADVAHTYPFFLAGGLSPGNVTEAVTKVGLWDENILRGGVTMSHMSRLWGRFTAKVELLAFVMFWVDNRSVTSVYRSNVPCVSY